VDILRRLTQSGSTHYQRERPSAIGRLHQAEDRSPRVLVPEILSFGVA